MQTMDHPLVPPIFLTNHTPPTNSLYRPLAFYMNVGPQPYIFPNPFDNAHVKPFVPSILLAFTIVHDQTL